ncbi:mucin-5AC-like [Cherax quadricarinatus]|uniref:mucin-5AC-like n=1 Tax=Cherax quadricarinatus TaxID=27406 RepID=UPI00387E36E6
MAYSTSLFVLVLVSVTLAAEFATQATYTPPSPISPSGGFGGNIGIAQNLPSGQTGAPVTSGNIGPVTSDAELRREGTSSGSASSGRSSNIRDSVTGNRFISSDSSDFLSGNRFVKSPGSLPTFVSGDSTSRRITGGPGVAGGQRVSGSGQVSRADFLITPTVTRLVTIDRFVTLTDLAFHSVAVTLTSLTVQTVAAGTRVVVATPVDERIALQTTVVFRPSSVTLTEVKSDFRIVTEVSVDHVTITHTSYIISQSTYTTTATQALTYTSTLVRTNIRTERTTFTDFQTITDTVYFGGSYGSTSP